MESEDDYDALFEKFVKQAETLGLAADKREKYVKESFDRLERKREKDERQKALEMEERQKEKEREERQKALEMEESRRQKEFDRQKEREDAQIEESRRQKELEREERERDRELLKEREEREHQLKQRELEIRQAEIGAGSRAPQNGRDSHTNVGARPVYPRLPAFREQQDDIDSYLFRFETHAKSLGWEETRWITYLSALLEGNALNLYHSLAAAGELTYQCLKENLLKKFQCTSETFRQKLRNIRPSEKEPFQTFGIELRRLFDRWVALSDITTDVDGLVNLFLGEQFLESVSADLATFIRERGLVTLDEMVKAAESYRLARPGKNLSRKSGPTIFSAGSCSHEEYAAAAFSQSNNRRGGPQSRRFGSSFAGRRQGNWSYGRGTSDAQAQSQGDTYYPRGSRRNRTGGRRGGLSRSGDYCNLCHEKGHWAYRCPVRDSKNPCPNCGLGAHDKRECPTAKFLANKQSANAVVADIGCSVTQAVGSLNLDHGCVNNVACSVLRDTGATICGVRSRLVAKDQFVGGSVACKTFGGEIHTYRQAKVMVQSSYYSGELLCCILEDPVADLIIGNIPGISEKVTECSPILERVAAVTTRAQAKRRDLPQKPLVEVETVSDKFHEKAKKTVLPVYGPEKPPLIVGDTIAVVQEEDDFTSLPTLPAPMSSSMKDEDISSIDFDKGLSEVQKSSLHEHVRGVLQKLSQFNLTAKPSKISTGCRSLEFLGHVVGEGMLRPQEEKIQKILAIPTPTTKKQVYKVSWATNFE
ncbi:uncharacterized protein [Littorina saxatilis]|uniref:uncharacterized protein n=1 Tax=Littorina saxatilis TaxID=31220 RepID=UPI0038B538D2